MKFHLSLIMVFSIITATSMQGQITAVEKGLQTITEDVIKAQLGFLSSDWMEGREAGEKGEYMAADYIASMLQSSGIKPGGDYLPGRLSENSSETGERSYFQNFILLKTLPGDEQVLMIKSSSGRTVKTLNLTWNVDFSVRPGDQAAEVDAPVVFSGYGYLNDTLKYNDFRKLDVRGKYILKISGFPKFINAKLNREKAAALSNELELKYKAMGITGIIEFDPEAAVVGSPEAKDFMNLSPSETRVYTGRPRAHFTIPGKNNSDNLIRIKVSVKAANEILNGTGIDLEEYISKADRNEKITIPELTGKSICFKSSVNISQVAVRNIIGIIEGKNPGKYIVLGAHYDHIGKGNGYIWNGADDNGSGTVAVMTIAKAIMATGEKPENSIVFALWTAEEEGLLGSRYYVRHLGPMREGLKLNMNFDMISRYISDDEPKKVTMTFSNSFPEFREMTSANLAKYGIDLQVDYQPSSNPPGGSDHRSFVEAGVPVIRFKPGHREEYHTPMDETSTVDWDIIEKIIKICFADTWDLANTKW